MTLDDEVSTLRQAAGLTRLDHVAAVRVDGPGALAALDLVSTRPLFVRETQMCHTLFLHEDAGFFADAYVCSGEDSVYVLAEGPAEAELLAYLERHCPDARGSMHGLSADFELWGINGPYAWEVTAELLGPPVLGMPYLTLMHAGEVICFRGGKTGEYGYDLLIPKADAASVVARLEQVGAPLGLRRVSLPALDQCALENWHFSIRTIRETELAQPLTPLELQLQWRVSFDRDFVGAPALRARRAAPDLVRATCFCAANPIAAGDPVRLGDSVVGEVLATGWSSTRNAWVGIALLPRRLAHPWISALHVTCGDSPVPIETMTPPLINNRSLYLDIHRHSFRTRDMDELPALVVS